MTAPAAHTTPAGTAAAGGPASTWAGDLLRAAAAPAACALVLIGLLSAWALIGGAGTISRVRIQVTQAVIPMSSFAAAAGAGRAAGHAYLTIRNLSGSADELTGASSPDASSVVLTRPGGTSGADRTGRPVAGLVIPAHGVVTLSPFGSDIVLTGTSRLRAGQQVPLTLVFRNAGRLTVEAAVTAPGAP